MKNKWINKLGTALYILATVLILTGAILKIQHYPYGLIILFAGLFLGGIADFRYIASLKKRIKELEGQSGINLNEEMGSAD